MISVGRKTVLVLKHLLDDNIDIQDNKGETSLMMGFGYPDCVQLLLDKPLTITCKPSYQLALKKVKGVGKVKFLKLSFLMISLAIYICTNSYL